MKILLTYLFFLIQGLNDLMISFWGYDRDLSDDEIFKNILERQLVKKNPHLKYIIKEYKSIENRFSKVDSTSLSYCDSELKAYKAELQRVERTSRIKFEAFKNKIADRDGENSELYSILSSISQKQLVQYFFEFENNTELDMFGLVFDLDFREYLLSSYIDYECLKFISNRITILSKIAKFFKAKLILYIQDRRILFRKLLSFLFKNLDDYHDTIIIQNVPFAVYKKLPVLIFNNEVYEKKHFRQNQRGYSFG